MLTRRLSHGVLRGSERQQAARRRRRRRYLLAAAPPGRCCIAGISRPVLSTIVASLYAGSRRRRGSFVANQVMYISRGGSNPRSHHFALARAAILLLYAMSHFFLSFFFFLHTLPLTHFIPVYPWDDNRLRRT